MKRSLFTIEIATNDGGKALFNTLDGALALVGDDVSEKDLADGGFLVDDNLDEEELLAERFLADMNETGFLTLCIAPTMACNLRCVYCYETHEHISMSGHVEAAIMRFIQQRYDAFRFKDLEILWYGGEPLLEISRMESLTEQMLQWCVTHDVRYHASITTNATLVDSSMARRLAGLHISKAMPTLDGDKRCHDARRPYANQTGSYEKTLQGIRELCTVGIEVGANLNLGWDNLESYRELRDKLRDECACPLYASHLRNYGGWCPGCGEGSDMSCRKGGDSSLAPELMSRPAYAKQLFELYRQTDPSAAALAESLRSKRAFCHGKMASYFVIDPEGYVYRCDGHMRNPRYRLFNVLDESYPLEYPETLSPYERNPRCKGCAIMPLCLGDCDWEWEMFEDNCNALKYTIGDYVRLLVERIGAALDADEKMLQLLPPENVAARYSIPFDPFGSDSVV